MKRIVVAVAALVAICVGFDGGPARAEGQDWHAILTPPLMARIESVLTMDGKATEEQFNARALAFEYWLGGNVEKLKGNPAQTLEAGLAVIAAASETVLAAGSGGGGNVPPCVAQHQSAIKNCSHYQGGSGKQDCLRIALTDYVMCLHREGCNLWRYGIQAYLDMNGCPGTKVGSCKDTVGDAYQIPVQGETIGFHLDVRNFTSPGLLGHDIKVTVKYNGKVVLGPQIIQEDTSWSVDFSAPVNGPPVNSNGMDLRTGNVSIEVNMDPWQTKYNDYGWSYHLMCH